MVIAQTIPSGIKPVDSRLPIGIVKQSECISDNQVESAVCLTDSRNRLEIDLGRTVFRKKGAYQMTA